MNRPTVQGLYGFGLEVPELDTGQRFYETFGLVADEPGVDALRSLSCQGAAKGQVQLRPGAAKRLDHVSFRVDPGDLDNLAAHIASTGVDLVGSRPGWSRPGLWFEDPWGTWINLCPAEPTPTTQSPSFASNTGGRSDRVDVDLWLELDRGSKPDALGHLLLFTADWEQAERFYHETLGLWVSDRAAGKMSFMAAGNGIVDHHCFGLVKSTHRGFQHASFRVDGIDDIGFGVARMRESGYVDSFGPGRHSIASNLFHYVRDPWGSWVEYYADMDKITSDWVTRDHDSLPYIWGPEWSPEFWGGEMNANHEAP